MYDVLIKGAKVRLIVDLTRYHPSLVKGTEGVAQEYGAGGLWARNEPDRFVSVVFEKAGAMDILRKSLDKVV